MSVIKCFHLPQPTLEDVTAVTEEGKQCRNVIFKWKPSSELRTWKEWKVEQVRW